MATVSRFTGHTKKKKNAVKSHLFLLTLSRKIIGSGGVLREEEGTWGGPWEDPRGGGGGGGGGGANRKTERGSVRRGFSHSEAN